MHLACWQASRVSPDSVSVCHEAPSARRDSGVEVIRPQHRAEMEVSDFLRTNAAWIVSQIERVERFRSIRKPCQSVAGRILFRGESTSVAN